MVAIIIPGRSGPLVAGGSGAAATVWDQATAGPSLTFPTTLQVEAQSVTGTASSVRTNSSHSTGKYYAEFTLTAMNFKFAIGIGGGSLLTTGDLGSDAVPSNGLGANVVGKWHQSGVDTTLFSSNWAVGDLLDLAIDLDNQLAWVRRNNAGGWNPSVGGTPDPATGVGGADQGDPAGLADRAHG